MEKIHIPIVIGTARVGRQSDRVARAIAKLLAEQTDCTAELVDVRDHITEAVTVPPWGEGGATATPTKWKGIMEASQALILVVPEYNHGYPGELKLLLDSLWNEYLHKPVLLIGVSKGTLGGARVIDHIKPVLIELKLHPIKEAVGISQVTEAVSASDTFTNEETVEYLQRAVTELVKLAEVLTPAQKTT